MTLGILLPQIDKFTLLRACLGSSQGYLDILTSLAGLSSLKMVALPLQLVVFVDWQQEERLRQQYQLVPPQLLRPSVDRVEILVCLRG